MVDFRGQRRSNDTHASTTDEEAKLARKGKGKEAKLSYGGHALMENRNGLCVDLAVRSAIQTETEAAKEMLARQRRKRVRPASLGGDKGYHTKDFVAHLRKQEDRPAHRSDRRPQHPGAGCAHDAPRRLRGESAKAQTRRRDLRLDEGLRRIAPHARARSCAGADARLHRRRSLQPVAHESTVPWHRVDPSGEPKNGPFASRSRSKNSKSRPQERSGAPSKQFTEIEGRHFHSFCIRLLGPYPQIPDPRAPSTRPRTRPRTMTFVEGRALDSWSPREVGPPDTGCPGPDLLRLNAHGVADPALPS